MANDSTSGTVLWAAESEELEKSIMRLASGLPSHSTRHSELQKMSCILDFHYFFDKPFSAERMFQQVLKAALEISGAERGFVLRRDPTGGEGLVEVIVEIQNAGHLLQFRMSGGIGRQNAGQ